MTNWKLLPLAAALIAVLGARATGGELEDKRDAKMKEAFIQKAGWILEYAKARDEAKKAGKPILVYFTRSYAP